MKTCHVIPLIIALLMSPNGLAEDSSLLRLSRRWNRSAPLRQNTIDCFSKGRTAVGLKDFALAAEYFNKAVRDAPLSAEYLIHLALAYDMLGREQSVENTWGRWETLALVYYRACLAADPEGEYGTRARKRALELEVTLETKNRKLVEHAYRVIPKIGGPKGLVTQNEHYGHLAWAFADAGDSRGARKALSRVRKTIPRYDFPADNRYIRAWEDLEGMDRALIGVIESYLTRGRPADAEGDVRELNNKGKRALCSLLCAQARAEAGDTADARTLLEKAAALGVTEDVFVEFGHRHHHIPTEVAVTRAMLGDIARARADLPGLDARQQARVLAAIALSLAKSGNAEDALAAAAEMRTMHQLDDGFSRFEKTFARITYVPQIAEVAEALAESGHAAEARTVLGEVMAMISGAGITPQNAYALYCAHMAADDIKAAERIYHGRLQVPPLSYRVVSEHAKLQGRMATAEVADWLRVGWAVDARFRNKEGRTPREMSREDDDPDKLTKSIIIAIRAVGYGRRLIRELDWEWKQAEFAPEGRSRYEEAVPETAESLATPESVPTPEKKENFIKGAFNYVAAAFTDRSRPIWHRIFVSRTEGWIIATVKYAALCIGGFFLLAAVLCVFDRDGSDAVFTILLFAALVTTAYVIGWPISELVKRESQGKALFNVCYSGPANLIQ